MLQVFNDMLKPPTGTITAANGTTANNNDNSTTATQQQQLLDNNTASVTRGNNNNNNNATTSIDELEKSILQLRDDINNKASPKEVMTIVHLRIHPALMQLYGLIPETEEEHQSH
jgi:hypothetical protein